MNHCSKDVEEIGETRDTNLRVTGVQVRTSTLLTHLPVGTPFCTWL